MRAMTLFLLLKDNREHSFFYFFKITVAFLLRTLYNIYTTYSEVIKMANNTSFTKMYEDLPKIVKIILQLILGGLIGGIYRILRYVETKNVVTLVVGILVLVTGIGNLIVWIADLITEILYNRITILAD